MMMMLFWQRPVLVNGTESGKHQDHLQIVKL